MIYYNNFTNWEDVVNEFYEVYAECPEPDEVILADYRYESYEGDAWIVYRNGEKYYSIDAGHCSCYGLEGQFDPEEYDTKDLFIACLEKRKGGWCCGVVKERIDEVLNKLTQPTQSEDI